MPRAFMFAPDVSSQVIWSICRVFSVVTGMSRSFMFGLNMLCLMTCLIRNVFMFTRNKSAQLTCGSCIVFTFGTGGSRSFVFAPNMSSQIICSDCGIFTFITGIVHSFIFTLNMSSNDLFWGQRIHIYHRDSSLLHIYSQYVVSNDLL